MQYLHKTAIITGASGGIGAAIAKRLAAEGYTVAVHYGRNAEKARTLADSIGGYAGCADLGVPSEIDRMVDEVLQKFGRLDLLVCNAGMSITGLFQDTYSPTS